MSCLFFLLPFVVALVLSLWDINFMGESRGFLGLEHYISFFTSIHTLNILRYSFLFLAICLVCILCSAFVIALLLKNSFAGQGFFRTVLILPWVVAGISAAYMFRWLFSESSAGLVNKVLELFGFAKVFWLSDGRMNFLVVIFCIVWKAVPAPMIILLSGMQSIPNEYYEVVDIDGGGLLIKTRYITIPMLLGQFRIIMITSTLGLLGGVDIMRSIGGSQDYRVIGYAMYMEVFSNYNVSSGAAIGAIMMILCVLLAVLYTKLLRLNEGASNET
jgi:ABC-type sugar transport system permease subunit